MKRSIVILKSFFETGDTPTQEQFSDLIDSLFHKDDGKLVTLLNEDAQGNITLTLSDGSSKTIEKYTLPNELPISLITDLQNILDTKVDKVLGKQLSTEDFTNELKQKLENLSNYVHPEKHLISEVEDLQTELDSKVDKVAGKELSSNDFTHELKDRLDNLNTTIIKHPLNNDPTKRDIIEPYDKVYNKWLDNQTLLESGVYILGDEMLEASYRQEDLVINTIIKP